MVFENLFAGVVNQFLGNYIESVNRRDISFGLDGMSFCFLFCTLSETCKFSLLKVQ